MFEVILGAVCLGVLAVEVIEVRQKCEEPWPGMWNEMTATRGEIHRGEWRAGKPGTASTVKVRA